MLNKFYRLLLEKSNKNRGTTFKVVSLLQNQYNFPWRICLYLSLTILTTYIYSIIFKILTLSIKGFTNLIQIPLWFYTLYRICKRYFKNRNK